MVVEYVAAPAPDIEELLQAAAPSSSTRDAAAAGADADGDAAMGEEDEDRGYGGLGLGATAGLGSTAGLGAGEGGALGLGFRKADEPPPVDPEVRKQRGGGHDDRGDTRGSSDTGRRGSSSRP